jgi:hypothetical protein
LPLIFSGLALAGTIGLGLFTLFKKPEEATKTAETLVDDVARKQIETLEKTVATQAQELTNRATNADLTDVQNGIEQVVKKIVKAERAEIYSVVDRQIITNVKQVTEKITAVDNNVKVLEQKHETALDDIRHQSQTIRGLKEQLDQIPMIGGNIVVHPETEALFTAPQKLTQTKGKSIDNNPSSWTSELMQKISKFNAEARKGVEERETGVDVKELIKLAFNHLTLEGTSGNPGEMKALAKALELVNTNVADPYKKQLKNLAYALRAVSDIYEGKATEEYVLSPLKEYIALSELQEKANGVLAIAKTNDVEKTKTAQANLMTWLENIFTKRRVENFNANNKAPMKTLPAPHSDSDWVRDQKLLEGDKPLAELTQTLLGSGFTMAEHPYMMGDVSTLSDAVNALRRALMKEQDYFTLGEGVVLNPPKGSLRNQLARTLNRIAKTLIPITDEAIEAGRVPLRAVEVDPKKPYLPDKMWNARLDGNEDGVKAVTAQMLEELREALVSDFMGKNLLPRFDGPEIDREVASFIVGYYPEAKTEAIAPQAFETIAQRGRNLPQGSNFVQSVINQFFEGVYKSESNVDALPHTLTEFYDVTSQLLIPELVNSPVKKEWQNSSFNAVLNYAKETGLNGHPCDKVEDFYQLASWEHFPTLKEKVQAVISARTESVEKVKAAQTALMAFLKDKFYKPEAQAPA